MKNRIVGGHVPSAKIVGERRYSIISDYLGTPVEAYNEESKRIWKHEACDAVLSEIEVDRTNSDEPLVVALLRNGVICVHFLCEHVFPTLTNNLSLKRLFGAGWYLL